MKGARMRVGKVDVKRIQIEDVDVFESGGRVASESAEKGNAITGMQLHAAADQLPAQRGGFGVKVDAVHHRAWQPRYKTVEQDRALPLFGPRAHIAYAARLDHENRSGEIVEILEDVFQRLLP